MRRMLPLLIICAAAAATATQAGSAIQEADALTVRVIDSPVFLPVTADCAVERLRTKLRSTAGVVIGDNSVCYRSATVSGFTETLDLVETFYVPGGAIETHQTLLLTFSSDLPVASVASTGVVTQATGVYLGATGSVTGSGTIAVDADGTVHPDLTFVIAFG